MARIPEEELARLKREVNLAALVRASGVELEPCGESLRGKCPWHDDSTPSLIVSPEKGLWNCMAGCGGGSALDWIMRTQGVSVRQAIDLLRARDARLTPAAARVKKSTVPHLPVPVTLSADDQGLLNDVVAFYHETLKGPSGEGARQYLVSRGLVSAELIDRFKLGYANRSLGYRLPNRNRKSAGEVRRRLRALGIFREKTGHEHLCGCVTVPIFEGPNVVGLYGRKASRDADEPHHLYLKGRHRGVWNEEALATSREVILAEAAFDAATIWCAGLRNVTWSYGVQGFTDDHLAALKRHGVERVVIAYDRDEAGDIAAEVLAPRLADAGLDVARVLFPRTKDQKDANAYAQHVAASGGNPAEALGVLLRSAQFVLKGRRVAASVPPGAAGLAELAAPPADTPPSRPSEDLGAAATKVTVDPPAAPALAEAPPSVPGSAAKGQSPEGDAADTAAAEPVAGAAVDSPAQDGASTPIGSTPAPCDNAAEPSVPEGAPVLAASHPSPAPEPLPLAAVPEPPASPSLDAGIAAEVSVNGDEVLIVFGERVYRVLDLWRNTSLGRLEVSLRLSAPAKASYEDIIELRKARARDAYVASASAELGLPAEVVKKDLGRVLLALEDLQQKRLARGKDARPRNVEIPPAEKAEAFAFLREARLIDLIVSDFDRIGLVGERKNKLVAYLAATSRKMDDPLAVLIQSNSAAGKSALMDAVLGMMPSEDVERFTAMTAQSIYYMADLSLKHRILAIAEVAGAEKAGYPIKCLQSDGRISIATTVKDPDTGEMKTKRHDVEGPVAIMLTTTEAEVDEELQNRAIVLSVNEDREQTKAIHEAQRHAQTLAGMLARRRRSCVERLHQNAQRLLRPLLVVNPFADELTFATSKLRTRRDHMKYLAMIRAVALLHQYQRPVRETVQEGPQGGSPEVVSYVEVTREDIAIAHDLANEVFGRSLDDLAPQTRRLLGLLDEMVTARCAERKVAREDLRFSRREVREYTNWSEKTVRKHLDRLVELELVLIHRGRRGQSFVHELVYNGEGSDGGRFAVGLADPRRLARGSTMATSST